MDNEYLVSVIVATYRRNSELKRALESLINQTYKNIEIIVVDDNADELWNHQVSEIVNSFKAVSSFPIIHIINESNLGSARTRNKGIENSKGHYITFLDDDDLYLNDKIMNQVSFMIDNNLDYSITELELYSDSDRLVDKRSRKYIKEVSKKALFEYHMKYHMTGTDTMMFKKEYLSRIGGFPHINVGDEFYLMQRAIEHDGKFGHLPLCDVKAYVHVGERSLSSGMGKIKGENDLYEYKKQYFNVLSSKAVKYIKTRHYVVIAYAYLRMRALFRFACYLVLSFLSSPICFISILFER